jgi:phosphate transport system substrate-binding protein
MYKHLGWTALTAICLIAGCTQQQPSTDTKTPAAASITIKGSDTMVHLVTAWAEDYMKANSGTAISVTGGGSGTGISALLNKTTDICSASRDMSAKEKEQAAQKGLGLKETIVARDGIAVIVHPSNPVNELTMEQLRKIYTGAYTEWKQAGGGDGEFIVLSRESSSGTYAFFQEHVLKKEDYTPKARLMPATSSIIQAVSEDVNAIGYVGLGYAAEAGAKVKVLLVKADANAPGVKPSEATVLSGEYPIARALYLYSDEKGLQAGQRFIEYCLGEAGQAIARKAGYVPVK